MESLIKYSWPKEFNPLEIPFPIITYNEAMENYGSDKPDTRFGFKVFILYSFEIFLSCRWM